MRIFISVLSKSIYRHAVISSKDMQEMCHTIILFNSMSGLLCDAVACIYFMCMSVINYKIHSNVFVCIVGLEFLL